MHISQLKIGQPARILSLGESDPAYRRRLLAMGLLPGTSLIVSRIAPLGDPIEIQVRGYALSLRKSEAQCIQIEEIVP